MATEALEGLVLFIRGPTERRLVAGLLAAGVFGQSFRHMMFG